MKDEEMAEEIANKRCHEIMCYGHCSFNSPKHHRCGEWHREYNCALEGLKAGRPQWHKSNEKLPDTTVLDELGNKVLYDYNTHCWRYDDADLTIAPTPVAWCEIPTFDKE